MRILWAADGLNGKGNNANHRTTPTTLNWKEIDTYVVKANGVWLWVPERRVLSFVHEKDCRKDFCLLQPMVKQAPVHLVYVYDQAKTQGLMTDLAMQIVQFINRKNITKLSNEVMAHAPLLDTGAKVMSVYMACAALNINCLARLTLTRIRCTTRFSSPQRKCPCACRRSATDPKDFWISLSDRPNV